MSDSIRNACVFIVLGIIINAICSWLQSDFLSKFIDENLITLLVALLAINITTISVIMTKLKDLSENKKINFSDAIKSMKVSIFEQVTLIIVGLIALVAKNSIVILNVLPSIIFITNVILISVFGFAIQILYDTAKGTFIILDFENKFRNPIEKIDTKNQT